MIQITAQMRVLVAIEPVDGRNTTGDALIPPDPAKAQEGWLRMQPQVSGG